MVLDSDVNGGWNGGWGISLPVVGEPPVRAFRLPP